MEKCETNGGLDDAVVSAFLTWDRRERKREKKKRHFELISPARKRAGAFESA